MELAQLFDTRETFSGSKIALMHDRQILVYERDNFPHIRYPGLIDLPGGGREGNETPFECLIREVMEEFGIQLRKADILWGKSYLNPLYSGEVTVFFGGIIAPKTIEKITFGDEGHSWRMMHLDEFFENRNVVPTFVERTKDYLRRAD